MSQPPHPDRLTRSSLGAEYLDHVARRGAAPADLIAEAAASDLLSVAYRGRFLPAPVFISAAERTRLADDLGTLYALLTDLPNRLFGGDLAALARGVGMNEHQTSVVCRAAATGAPLVPLARSDLYRDEDGFRLLELNITSALGGFENADICRAMLHHPALAEFAEAHGLDHPDTIRTIRDALFAECAAFLPEGRRPVVALTDWPESFRTYEPRLRVWAALLERLGVDAVPCHVGQIRARGDRLEVGGRTVDIVFRFFLVEEIATAQDAELVEPVLRAVERGGVGMFSRLDAELYGNKGALAMLSDDRHRDAFNAAELACVDRFLPWTRPVRRMVADGDGGELPLLPYAVREQQELILKPTLLHGGSGVVAGWTVDAARWRAHLDEALDGPYVLQRRVHPMAERFPGAPGAAPEELYLNWGVFYADPAVAGGDGYAGCIIRGSLDPQVGVVSMGGGARVGCCLHEPAPVSAPGPASASAATSRSAVPPVRVPAGMSDSAHGAK
ncbi:hypothetical protein [Streptomyces odontomachi]|uniref:hypothetical protein n=1 Tax=Streptomyces odontomachi TaxID=2944940 RepID=UPI00210A439A|nr:hypothetical protein [Streptomyces sp. ODS25]